MRKVIEKFFVVKIFFFLQQIRFNYSNSLAVSLEMSIKVQALGLEGTRATTLASNGKDRLKELRRQLDAARTNCVLRDRPLCETIDTSSLDIIIRFEMVLTLSILFENLICLIEKIYS